MGRGIRTFLVTPLLREGTAIGLISIRRTEVKPFTDKQVALLETFASQAVIAIENVRLFKEFRSATASFRGVGAADGDERDSGRHRQLADGHAAGAGCHVESAARVCGSDDAHWIASMATVMVAAGSYGPNLAHGAVEIRSR